MPEILAVHNHSFHFRQIHSDGTYTNRYLGDLGVLVQQSSIPFSGVMDKSVANVQSSNLIVEGGSFLTGQLDFKIFAQTSDYREAESIRARMLKWLYVRGEGRLWFDDWVPDQFFRASLFNVSAMEFIGAGFECSLSFYVAPFRFSHEEYSIGMLPTGSPETILINTSERIRGLQFAHPTWTIENTSGGTISVPITLFNSTTNESLTWQGTLLDTEFLRIDSTGRKTVEQASTEIALGDPGTDKISGILAGSVFPTLQGDEINSIDLTGLTDTTITVRYHAEF